MDKIERFPDKSEFPDYEKEFWSILRKFVLAGSYLRPVDPSGVIDATDLINEFYAFEWDGLAQRYDPAIGPARNYICGAFRWFVVDYIRESNKLRSRSRDLAELANQVADEASSSPLETLERREEVVLFQAALAELPPARRKALLDYFGLKRPSIRKLADLYEKSRSSVSNLLFNAYGQLVVRLAARDVWLPSDREVALALWCDGAEDEEAAARLRRPVKEIRETRKRLLKVFARLLTSGRGDLSALTREMNSSPRPRKVRDSIPSSACPRE